MIRKRKFFPARYPAEQNPGPQERHAVDFAAIMHALPVNVLVLHPTDATITFANRRSVETLHSLRAHLPASVNPDAMVGLTMDVFHKNPSAQHRRRPDPSALAHQDQARPEDARSPRLPCP
ncbi:hypothetical protein [Methylobacterium sp. Leaf123]|uniref:hypothetical protein n=1 Tax=Methylobacterium sp. Leaf123 TaxID=1736264 RepID=UPI000A4B004D|nr:hypothetical protein [Methylobacterium sp. Leaf123]